MKVGGINPPEGV